jgi:hypothetical protein
MEQFTPRVNITSVHTSVSRIVFEWHINIEGENLEAISKILAMQLDRMLGVYFTHCYKLAQYGFRLYGVSAEPINMLLRMEIMVDREWRLMHLAEDIDLQHIRDVLDGLLPFVTHGPTKP